jgi:murein L,D-transpeptidase YcbB/YkuD
MKLINSYKSRRKTYAIGPSILLLTPLLYALCGGPVSSVALAADASPTPGASASATPVPQALGELGNLIASKELPELRWPNFSEVQPDVVKFYALGTTTPLAWSHDGQPTAQAQAMIQLFKQASLKGLNPDDYDASRWDARLAALAPSNPHPDDTAVMHFDLALTVCAARYLSALHIGRVSPQHFKFGLAVGSNTFDLAEVLRNQVVQAPDVSAVVASVEPHYDGYGRAETALAAYIKLAAQGDGAPLPLPDKSVHPGASLVILRLTPARPPTPPSTRAPWSTG